MLYVLLSELRSEVIVRFVDIGGMVDHCCFNFLFAIVGHCTLPFPMVMILWLWLRNLSPERSLHIIGYLQSGHSKDKDLCLVVIHYMSLFLWLRLGVLWSVIVLHCICYLQSGYSKDKDLCLVVIHYMSFFLWLRPGILWSVIVLHCICYLQSGYSKDKDLCLVVIHYMSLFLWLRLGVLWSVIVLYVTFSVDIVGGDFCMVLNHGNPAFCMSMVKARVPIWWLVIVHDVSHSTLQKKNNFTIKYNLFSYHLIFIALEFTTSF